MKVKVTFSRSENSKIVMSNLSEVLSWENAHEHMIEEFEINSVMVTDCNEDNVEE